MINPNICKYVYVEVLEGSKFARYNSVEIQINDYKHPAPKPGRRRMYLKYSIMSDSYYLTSRR